MLAPNSALDTRRRGPVHLSARWPALIAVAVFLVGILAANLGFALWQASASATALASQRRSISELQARVIGLETAARSQPEWSVIARTAEPSVFTIATKTGLGSGWVAHTDASGSDVVTNFHVVAEAWSAAEVMVEMRQGDRTIAGTITRVDPSDDLAVVHINEQFPSLHTAASRPHLGDPVLAIGSPLGLAGTVSIGVVSGFRSLEGSDYVQISAPISPGNSGGPVLDRHGRVVAVAAAKFSGQGVEALSLAIPVQNACMAIIRCESE